MNIILLFYTIDMIEKGTRIIDIESDYKSWELFLSYKGILKIPVIGQWDITGVDDI